MCDLKYEKKWTERLELRDYLRILRKSWIVILVCALLGVGTTAAWSLSRIPKYQAIATLYVSVRTDEASTLEDWAQGNTFVRQSVASYVDVVNRAIVMDRVGEKLKLDPVSLATQVSANSPKNTVLVNITVTDTDPDQAATIANVTGAVFADVVSNQLEKPSDGSLSRVQIETVQPALVPSAPVSPKTTQDLARGLFVGLAIGLGLAVLREVLDTRVRSKNDIRSLTNAPIIGGIVFDDEVSKRPLVVRDAPRSHKAEAYRSMRTNLQFIEIGSQDRSFVITSSKPGEGKTITTLNLSVALAEIGSKLALIDGDLRKPKLDKYLGLEGAVGLTDYLIGRASMEDALQQWGKTNMFVLPAGSAPPNPAELLGSTRMKELIQYLSDHFDYVLIDAPPILAVTDASVVSKFTNGMLMVVAANETKKPELTSALESLESSNTTLAGVILTKLPTKGPDAHRYGAYSYSYGDDDSSAPVSKGT